MQDGDSGLPQRPADVASAQAKARDELFDEAVQVVTEAGRGSVTILQRKLRVGYNRASSLVGQLEAAGILGPDRGRSQGREVYLQGAEEGEKEESVPEEAPQSGEGESVSLLTSHASLLEHGDAPVDNGQAELTPPPDDDDAPPRIWM